MDDKFDKELTNRIREVFEDYPYPPADKGWQELRKNFPAGGKKDKIAWLWWGSAAAVLLVFLGVGIWLYRADEPAGNFASNKPSKTLNRDSNLNNILADTAASRGSIDSQQPAQIADEARSALPKSSVRTNDLAAGAAPAEAIQKNENQAITIAKQPAQTYLPGQADGLAPGKVITDKSITNPVIAAVPDEVATAKNTDVTSKTSQSPVGVTETHVVANSTTIAANPQQPAKTIVELMQGENNAIAAKKSEPAKQADKRVNFSVYAATYINYAQGSANQINAGAGFTSDIKLSNNFKLSTGVSLAQNTLKYDKAPPTRDGGLAYASAAALSKDAGFASSYNVPVFQNYSARLVGLDIPVNIKYEFNPQKSDTYISAGLSSGTFIDERYTASYQYRTNVATANGNVVNNFTTIKTDDEASNKSFNGFYFGKTLNVSFGVGYPLGKSNRLIIEPFLKYPLDGLGAQQIKFGAGGLNLKVNFKGSKR
ncbi:hypothetical protein [Mucilaginibacter sp.]|uniref:hypothetical protein n=1 Tax=Mucilaginibacter sp. TaxID=1882438 RepID=UPI0035BC1DE3